MLQNADGKEKQAITEELNKAKNKIQNEQDIDNNLGNDKALKKITKTMENSLNSLHKNGYSNEKIAGVISQDEDLSNFMNNPEYSQFILTPFHNLAANVSLQGIADKDSQSLKNVIIEQRDSFDGLFEDRFENNIRDNDENRFNKLNKNKNIIKTLDSNISNIEKLDEILEEIETRNIKLDGEKQNDLLLNPLGGLKEIVKSGENKLSLQELNQQIDSFEKNNTSLEDLTQNFENIQENYKQIKSKNEKLPQHAKFMDEKMEKELSNKFGELESKISPLVELNKQIDSFEASNASQNLPMHNFENIQENYKQVKADNADLPQYAKFMDEKVEEELSTKFQGLENNRLPGAVILYHDKKLSELEEKAKNNTPVGISEYSLLSSDTQKAAKKFADDTSNEISGFSMKHHKQIEELYSELNIPEISGRGEYANKGVPPHNLAATSSSESISSGGSESRETESEASVSSNSQNAKTIKDKFKNAAQSFREKVKNSKDKAGQINR